MCKDQTKRACFSKALVALASRCVEYHSEQFLVALVDDVSDPCIGSLGCQDGVSRGALPLRDLYAAYLLEVGVDPSQRDCLVNQWSLDKQFKLSKLPTIGLLTFPLSSSRRAN